VIWPPAVRLAPEEIAGALAQDKIATTDQERGDMLTPGYPDEDGRPRAQRARFGSQARS